MNEEQQNFEGNIFILFSSQMKAIFSQFLVLELNFIVLWYMNYTDTRKAYVSPKQFREIMIEDKTEHTSLYHVI